MSGFDGWRTDRLEWAEWNKEFGFTLDVAADHENALCDLYCTEEGTFSRNPTIFDDDEYYRINDEHGLSFDWTDHIVWCNPPYAGHQLHKWVKKAAERKALTAVLLLPVSMGSSWMRDYVWPKDRHIRESANYGWRKGWKGIQWNTGFLKYEELLFRDGRMKFFDPRNPDKNDPMGDNMLWIVRKA